MNSAWRFAARRSGRIFLLAFLAACLFCAWGCGQNPAAVGTNREEPSPQPTARSAVSAADRYDLARDEARGGHTLSKHVGRTDEQLAERLQHEGNISAASTWTDLATAEQTVAEGLRFNRGRIESWMRRDYPRPNLALHYDAGRAIGRSLRRGDDRSVECIAAVIVLRADGPDSFYVLTTYPRLGSHDGPG